MMLTKKQEQLAGFLKRAHGFSIAKQDKI